MMKKVKNAESAKFQFQKIPNDRFHNEKVFASKLFETIPHLVDESDVRSLISKNFIKYYNIHMTDKRFLRFAMPYIKKEYTHFKIPRFIKKNLAIFSEIVGLSDLECEVLYVLNLIHDCHNYMSYRKEKFMFNNIIKLLAKLTNSNPIKIKSMLNMKNKLVSYYLIKCSRKDDLYFEVTNIVEQIFNEPISKEKILNYVAKPIKRGTLNLDDFAYMKDDIDALIRFCKKVKNPSIFLYGKPGVGKNEIAKLLAKELNRELLEVLASNIDYDEDDKHNECNFLLAQKIFDKNKYMILLDECEDVFPEYSMRFFMEDKPSKHSQNKMLESIKIPSIFLSNSSNIDPAFLRRFDIVLEIKAPPLKKQKELIENALNKSNFKLKDEIIEQISSARISQGILLNAIKVAKAMPKSTQEKYFLKTINEQLKPQNKRLNPPISYKTPYNMGLINADMDMQTLANNLKNVSCGARILCYGMPGSGKSEFAKNLAKVLKKEIIIKKGSDLLSMWVGGSEKNIARAFELASESNSILVFDEVDSFLQDRKGASNSWEITQTNEMLTQMEGFEGIFIATTNFMDNLDSASLRRFDIKVHFKPLDLKRLCEAFSLYAEFLGLSDYRVFIESSKRDLNMLKNISLGDFSLIARSARFDKIGSCEELLNKLQNEERLKSENSAREIGF